jgi:hypothetical protein
MLFSASSASPCETKPFVDLACENRYWFIDAILFEHYDGGLALVF